MVRNLFLLFMLAHAFTAYATEADLDLETLTQDFVVEVKQIHIPGHPNACNPCIIRWQEQLLLSFDAYMDREDQPDAIGLVYLDEDFNVVGQPQILDLAKNLWQDPRFVINENRLYLVFNGAIPGGVRRMFMVEVQCKEGNFQAESPEALLTFANQNPDQWERNWIPFSYNNRILLTYGLMPHRIMQPLLGTQRCEDISSTLFTPGWDWGTPKPGTTAQLDKDHYLAFFHSIKVMPTQHSDGKSIQHYFMGAYTFEKLPPFCYQVHESNSNCG